MIGTVETNMFGCKEGRSSKLINDALNYVFYLFKDLLKWYYKLLKNLLINACVREKCFFKI